MAGEFLLVLMTLKFTSPSLSFKEFVFVSNLILSGNSFQLHNYTFQLDSLNSIVICMRRYFFRILVERYQSFLLALEISNFYGFFRMNFCWEKYIFTSLMQDEGFTLQKPSYTLSCECATERNSMLNCGRDFNDAQYSYCGWWGSFFYILQQLQILNDFCHSILLLCN
jgi:hypothetical protein